MTSENKETCGQGGNTDFIDKHYSLQLVFQKVRFCLENNIQNKMINALRKTYEL